MSVQIVSNMFVLVTIWAPKCTVHAKSRASFNVDFTLLTSCMLAMEKVARKNEDEDDDDDQHHNEDDVQVHGGYSGSHHHF